MLWNTMYVNVVLLMRSLLCEECSKWMDSVETTIEQHINEFKPVVHAKDGQLVEHKRNTT